MNRANEARDMTKRLSLLAEKYKCAILLIGHMNKAGGNKAAYQYLLLTGKLNEHLNQTDQEAREQVETLMEQMTEKQGVTEELKAQDQMERVRLMNNIKASAEEIVLKNMIYV